MNLLICNGYDENVCVNSNNDRCEHSTPHEYTGDCRKECKKIKSSYCIPYEVNEKYNSTIKALNEKYNSTIKALNDIVDEQELIIIQQTRKIEKLKSHFSDIKYLLSE